MSLTNETPEQIADRIVMRLRGRIIPPEREQSLQQDILLALRDRDERAALICEQGAILASPVGVIPADDPEHERLQRLANVLNSAARAIREGQ